MKTKVVKKETEGVRIIPLGGLESIGMNITAFECGDSIIVVDCGLSFPADDMLGIDLVIPDVTYLENNIDNCNIQIIKGADHSYTGKYNELGELLKDNL